MKLQPVLTEKSMKLAEEGKYVFMVDNCMTKNQIKKYIHEIFGKQVKDVRVIVCRSRERLTFRRKRVRQPGYKKAIVALAESETFDFFLKEK